MTFNLAFLTYTDWWQYGFNALDIWDGYQELPLNTPEAGLTIKVTYHPFRLSSLIPGWLRAA